VTYAFGQAILYKGRKAVFLHTTHREGEAVIFIEGGVLPEHVSIADIGPTLGDVTFQDCFGGLLG
jgi:hypothetical protein